MAVNPKSSALRAFAAKPYDSVAEILASRQITPDLAGQRIHTKDGMAYDVAEDQSVTDWHVQTAGGAKMYVVPMNGVMNVAAWGAIPADVDPGFDNADIFDRMMSYINGNTGNGSERNILFPVGQYQTSRKLRVSVSHVHFISETHHNGPGTTSAPSFRSAGSLIVLTGSDQDSLVHIESDTGYVYGFRMIGVCLRSYLSPKPRNLLKMVGCSEWEIAGAGIFGAQYLIEMANSGIGSFTDMNLSDSSVAHFRTYSSGRANIPAWPGAADVWFTKCNFWLSGGAFFQFDASFTARISVTQSWLERAYSIIKMAPTENRQAIADMIAFSDCGIRLDDHHPLSRNGWLVNVVANTTYPTQATKLRGISFDRGSISAPSSMTGDMVSFVKGANTAGNTFLERLLLNTVNLENVPTACALVYSDTANSTAWLRDCYEPNAGSTHSRGSAYVGVTETLFRRMSYKKMPAITLPQTAPNSFAADEGQIWFATSDSTLRYTAGGTQHRVPKQAAARADSAATDVAGVNAVLNDLLAKLRAAGVIAT